MQQDATMMMNRVRGIAATIAFLALALPASAQTSSQSQPTEESKKLPTGSAAERKARMSARANSRAYTKAFDLSALPHSRPIRQSRDMPSRSHRR